MGQINLQVPVPQRVTIDSAKERMQKLLTQMAKENAAMVSDLHEHWEGYKNTFRFKAKGFDISGIMTVGHTQVALTVSLPMMLGFFKGAIENEIKTKALKALNA